MKLKIYDAKGSATDKSVNLSKDVFSVFPVPSKDIINIKNIIKVLEFEIFNVTGKRIKSGKTNGTISITSLENGIYFLKIDENNQYQVQYI